MIIAWFSIGFFFSLSIYHFLVYLGRKKDLSYLYYSLFCLFYCFTYILFSKDYFNNYPVLFSMLRPWLMVFLGTSMGLFLISYFSLTKLNKYFLIYLIIQISTGILFTVIFLFTFNKINLILFYIVLTVNTVINMSIVAASIIKKKIYKEKRIKIIGFGIICAVLGGILVLVFSSFEIILPPYISRSFFILMGISFTYALTDSFNKDHHDLIDIKKTLEQKVEIRSQELKEALEQKNNFFINLAHETKTPLTLISNYLVKDIQKRGQSKEIEIVKQNFDFLMRNMNNFLDSEKLLSGQVYYDHQQDINLSMFLKKKVELFLPHAAKRKITVTSDIASSIYIQIDPYAIDRIINNLMDNAVKYNKENGKINIILKNYQGWSVLIIEDTGIGIKKTDKENIFKPYYQASHKKRNIQGLGMGLNIVKMILDQVNGKIEIKSSEKSGSMFKLFFPLCNKTESRENTKIKISKPINILTSLSYNKIPDIIYNEKKYTLFVVDDNLEMIWFLFESLNKKYNFYFACNGIQALEKIKNIPMPHLIISDIMMDEMDGLKFYDKLLEIKTMRYIPFIFLTAKNTEKVSALKKGAVDYISKPFDIDELKAKIDSIIRNNQALRDKAVLELAKEFNSYIGSLDIKTDDIVDFNINKTKDTVSILSDQYNLSPKELEISLLLEKGLEYKEIAQSLNISTSTVQSHVRKIYKKCNINNKIELINIIHQKNYKY